MRALALPLGLAAAALATGQEPPGQRYGRREGLPYDQVRSLHQDARGYVWIGTAGRLCRHDGGAIREWPPEARAPARVDCIVDGPDGRVLGGGTGPSLFVHDPTAQPCFTTLSLHGCELGRNTTGIGVDAHGGVWVATERGLFRATLTRTDATLSPYRPDARDLWNGALARDARGRIVYARSNLALRLDVHVAAASAVDPAGVEEVAVELPLARGNVCLVAAVADDRCRVLTDKHLFEVDFASRTHVELPLPAELTGLCAAGCIDRAGALWLATTDGLWRLGDGAPQRFLAGDWIRTLCADRAGDVWIGTQARGLLRASARPFTRLAGVGANGPARPVKLLRAGAESFAASWFDGLYRIDEHELSPTPFAAVEALRTGSNVAVDGDGVLWCCGGDASWCVPLAGTAAPASLPLRARRVCVDAAQRVVLTLDDAIVTCSRASDGTVQPSRVALPRELAGAVAVGGDGSGVLFCRSSTFELWRLTAAGAEPCTANGARIPLWTAHQGPPGQLWVLPSNRAGLAIVDVAHGAQCTVRHVGAADGLPDERIEAITVDADGRAWLAFPAVLCRYDARTAAVASWPWPADAGLGAPNDVLVDARGRVLIATDEHLIGFTPERHAPAPPPAVLVHTLTLAGIPIVLPDGGTATLPALEAPAGRGHVVVGWNTPGGSAGPTPVQHRLLPAERDFGPASTTPSVHLANLASGDYRLELRAAAYDGAPPGAPTVLELRVLPPFWARPAFVVSTVATALLLGLALHRFRVRRLLAMEAVRRQVATDLHDDLGSGLAQVAVLGEVGKQKAPALAGLLDEIAGLARGMRESMADIVWAVDPKQDTLAALVQRLRQVATNLFDDAATAVRWTTPPDALLAATALPPDRRRHLFLFAKEALTNAARHAAARTVAIEVGVAGGALRLVVADDGRGFAEHTVARGQGLRSLHGRADALGGRLQLTTAPGNGTTLALDVPAR